MGGLNERLSQLVQDGVFPNPITFATQLIATLILLLFLKRLVWKPMLAFLAKRSEVIVGELESAKQARLDAEQMKADYQNELKNAKKEANNILESARTQAMAARDEIVSGAEREAAYRIDKAEKEIELERKHAEAELKTQVVDLAFQAAEKLVNRNLDEVQNRRMIDHFINEVGE